MQDERSGLDRRHAYRSRFASQIPRGRSTTSTMPRCCRRTAARWASTPRGSGRPKATRASGRSGSPPPRRPAERAEEIWGVGQGTKPPCRSRSRSSRDPGDVARDRGAIKSLLAVPHRRHRQCPSPTSTFRPGGLPRHHQPRDGRAMPCAASVRRPDDVRARRSSLRRRRGAPCAAGAGEVRIAGVHRPSRRWPRSRGQGRRALAGARRSPDSRWPISNSWPRANR